MLKGLQNKKLYESLLEMSVEKMDKILKKQNIRMVLNLLHNSTKNEIIEKISDIEEMMLSRTSISSTPEDVTRISKLINKLNSLAINQ